MVSQPSNALALRGPSSVISSSRSRRHGRSHAGGSSYASQNEFPVFSNTGDVEIIVKAGSKTNRYLLHRLYLAQCSGFFEASTSEEWSRPGRNEEKGSELARVGDQAETASNSSASRDGGRKRWRYELEPATNEHEVPMLIQKEASSSSLFGSDVKPPPVRNKPPSSNPSFFRSVANLSLSHAPSAPAISQADQDLLNDYDNLFRIFYNYSPALDPIDIAVAYLQCKSLLNLADSYDALEVVGPRIDHHLLQFQSRLWKQVAKYPSSYLKLGYLAQSKSIFQEALIHVVGAWPAGERHIRHQLPRSVLDLIEDKVEDMEDMVGKIEGRLFRLTLTNSRGERVTPQNSYLDWLAVSLFRQWLAECTSTPPTPPLPRSKSAAHPHTHSHSSSHTRTSSTANPPTSSASAPAYDPALPPLPTRPSLGRIFRILGSPSSSTQYLNREECKRFLKLSPELYNRESLKKFEKRLEELKTMAREICRPLMRSALLGGEGVAGSVTYLTCTRVGPGDWVWERD